MLFNSVEFLVFFPVVAALYFALPYRARWGMLLAASYVFYMAWNPAYLILILASTLIDYTAAIRMARHETRAPRRRWLAMSLTLNLGLLFTFKYLNFVGESFRALLGLSGFSATFPHLDVLLPVGISFYTFQTLSYTIEVYRGNQKCVRSLPRLALYVSFFPQLVAGPIERPQRLLPQFEKNYDFDYERVVVGMRLVLWGMFKKVVIADRLSVVVDAVYGNPERFPGIMLVFATVFFAFQIYCDFSGYSDIAIGTARVFGIDLMKNFRRPYTAQSIAEFWRRWHISLSTWFRDYVYIPLGGNRVSRQRWMLGILAVFGLSGLWHGANWTYLIWGLLHAAFFTIGRLSETPRARAAGALGLAKIPQALKAARVGVTFVLVTFAWVFFRADSVTEAWYILTHCTQGWIDLEAYDGFNRLIGAMDLSPRAFQLDVALIVFLLIAEAVAGDREVSEFVGARRAWFRWGVYIVLGLAIMNLGVTQEIPFVYFQF